MWQSGVRSPRVVVVGGGMTGLSAACHLNQHGCQVTLLEAATRLGGRMHTVSFGKSARDIVELGGNFILGTALTNPIISLANQHGQLKDSVLFYRMKEGYCYRSDGKAIVKQCSDHLWSIFKDIEKEVEHISSLPDGVSNMAEFLRRRYLEEVERRKLHYDVTDVTSLFNCFMNYERFHVGGFPEQLGAVETFDNIPGGSVRVPSGMSAIIQALARQLPDDCVQFGHKVRQVEWNQRAVVHVHCENGRSFIADHVIVTVSLGCLKKYYSSMFYPPLPGNKIEAIKSLAFGKVNKIFLLYDQPFWQVGKGGIKLAWTDADGQIKSPSEWYKKIFAFDEVLNNENVLIAWLSGNEAEYMETLSDEAVMNTCTDVIRHFLGNDSIPKPRAVKRSQWCGDELFLGSYSNPTASARAKLYDVISQPLCDMANTPRVLFAGEATSSQTFTSMNAARQSGLREGDRLLRYHNMKTQAKL